ncbi:hypothetical protein [Streptomyces sp. NPDC094468]|uniref:WXG100-like domain-containing protein n=1 Tax=Streptomyces sp. NPDC094468 TaxID=3366066 RepID=UPI0037F37777
MGDLQMPDAVASVASFIVGQEWPKGSESGLRQLATAWGEGARQLEVLSGELGSSGSGVLESVGGRIAEEFRDFVTEMERMVPGLSQSAAQMSDLSEQTALQVEYAKAMIITQAILVFLQVLHFLLFGLPEAAAVVLTAGRFEVRQLLKELLISIGTGIALNEVSDVLVQVGQFIAGHRHQWDKDATASAVESGAIGGAVGGLTFGLARQFNRRFAVSLGGKLVLSAVVGGVTEGITYGIWGGDTASFGTAITSGFLGGLEGGHKFRFGSSHEGYVRLNDVEMPHLPTMSALTAALLAGAGAGIDVATALGASADAGAGAGAGARGSAEAGAGGGRGAGTGAGAGAGAGRNADAGRAGAMAERRALGLDTIKTAVLSGSARAGNELTTARDYTSPATAGSTAPHTATAPGWPGRSLADHPVTGDLDLHSLITYGDKTQTAPAQTGAGTATGPGAPRTTASSSAPTTETGTPNARATAAFNRPATGSDGPRTTASASGASPSAPAPVRTATGPQTGTPDTRTPSKPATATATAGDHGLAGFQTILHPSEPRVAPPDSSTTPDTPAPPPPSPGPGHPHPALSPDDRLLALKTYSELHGLLSGLPTPDRLGDLIERAGLAADAQGLPSGPALKAALDEVASRVRAGGTAYTPELGLSLARAAHIVAAQENTHNSTRLAQTTAQILLKGTRVGLRGGASGPAEIPETPVGGPGTAPGAERQPGPSTVSRPASVHEDPALRAIAPDDTEHPAGVESPGDVASPRPATPDAPPARPEAPPAESPPSSQDPVELARPALPEASLHNVQTLVRMYDSLNTNSEPHPPSVLADPPDVHVPTLRRNWEGQPTPRPSDTAHPGEPGASEPRPTVDPPEAHDGSTPDDGASADHPHDGTPQGARQDSSEGTDGFLQHRPQPSPGWQPPPISAGGKTPSGTTGETRDHASDDESERPSPRIVRIERTPRTPEPSLRTATSGTTEPGPRPETDTEPAAVRPETAAPTEPEALDGASGPPAAEHERALTDGTGITPDEETRRPDGSHDPSVPGIREEGADGHSSSAHLPIGSDTPRNAPSPHDLPQRQHDRRQHLSGVTFIGVDPSLMDALRTRIENSVQHEHGGVRELRQHLDTLLQASNFIGKLPDMVTGWSFAVHAGSTVYDVHIKANPAPWTPPSNERYTPRDIPLLPTDRRAYERTATSAPEQESTDRFIVATRAGIDLSDGYGIAVGDKTVPVSGAVKFLGSAYIARTSSGPTSTRVTKSALTGDATVKVSDFAFDVTIRRDGVQQPSGGPALTGSVVASVLDRDPAHRETWERVNHPLEVTGLSEVHQEAFALLPSERYASSAAHGKIVEFLSPAHIVAHYAEARRQGIYSPRLTLTNGDHIWLHLRVHEPEAPSEHLGSVTNSHTIETTAGTKFLTGQIGIKTLYSVTLGTGIQWKPLDYVSTSIKGSFSTAPTTLKESWLQSSVTESSSTTRTGTSDLLRTPVDFSLQVLRENEIPAGPRAAIPGDVIGIRELPHASDQSPAPQAGDSSQSSLPSQEATPGPSLTAADLQGTSAHTTFSEFVSLEVPYRAITDALNTAVHGMLPDPNRTDRAFRSEAVENQRAILAAISPESLLSTMHQLVGDDGVEVPLKTSHVPDVQGSNYRLRIRADLQTNSASHIGATESPVKSTVTEKSTAERKTLVEKKIGLEVSGNAAVTRQAPSTPQPGTFVPSGSIGAATAPVTVDATLDGLEVRRDFEVTDPGNAHSVPMTFRFTVLHDGDGGNAPLIPSARADVRVEVRPPRPTTPTTPPLTVPSDLPAHHTVRRVTQLATLRRAIGEAVATGFPTSAGERERRVWTALGLRQEPDFAQILRHHTQDSHLSALIGRSVRSGSWVSSLDEHLSPAPGGPAGRKLPRVGFSLRANVGNLTRESTAFQGTLRISRASETGTITFNQRSFWGSGAVGFDASNDVPVGTFQARGGVKGTFSYQKDNVDIDKHTSARTQEMTLTDTRFRLYSADVDIEVAGRVTDEHGGVSFGAPQTSRGHRIHFLVPEEEQHQVSESSPDQATSSSGPGHRDGPAHLPPLHNMVAEIRGTDAIMQEVTRQLGSLDVARSFSDVLESDYLSANFHKLTTTGISTERVHSGRSARTVWELHLHGAITHIQDDGNDPRRTVTQKMAVTESVSNKNQGKASWGGEAGFRMAGRPNVLPANTDLGSFTYGGGFAREIGTEGGNSQTITFDNKGIAGTRHLTANLTVTVSVSKKVGLSYDRLEAPRPVTLANVGLWAPRLTSGLDLNSPELNRRDAGPHDAGPATDQEGLPLQPPRALQEARENALRSGYELVDFSAFGELRQAIVDVTAGRGVDTRDGILGIIPRPGVPQILTDVATRWTIDTHLPAASPLRIEQALPVQLREVIRQSITPESLYTHFEDLKGEGYTLPGSGITISVRPDGDFEPIGHVTAPEVEISLSRAEVLDKHIMDGVRHDANLGVTAGFFEDSFGLGTAHITKENLSFNNDRPVAMPPGVPSRGLPARDLPGGLPMTHPAMAAISRRIELRRQPVTVTVRNESHRQEFRATIAYWAATVSGDPVAEDGPARRPALTPSPDTSSRSLPVVNPPFSGGSRRTSVESPQPEHTSALGERPGPTRPDRPQTPPEAGAPTDGGRPAVPRLPVPSLHMSFEGQDHRRPITDIDEFATAVARRTEHREVGRLSRLRVVVQASDTGLGGLTPSERAIQRTEREADARATVTARVQQELDRLGSAASADDVIEFAAPPRSPGPRLADAPRHAETETGALRGGGDSIPGRSPRHEREAVPPTPKRIGKQPAYGENDPGGLGKRVARAQEMVGGLSAFSRTELIEALQEQEQRLRSEQVPAARIEVMDVSRAQQLAALARTRVQSTARDMGQAPAEAGDTRGGTLRSPHPRSESVGARPAGDPVPASDDQPSPRTDQAQSESGDGRRPPADDSVSVARVDTSDAMVSGLGILLDAHLQRILSRATLLPGAAEATREAIRDLAVSDRAVQGLHRALSSYGASVELPRFFDAWWDKQRMSAGDVGTDYAGRSNEFTLPTRTELESAVEDALWAIRLTDEDTIMGRLAEALHVQESEVGGLMGFSDGLLSPFLDGRLSIGLSHEEYDPRTVARVAVAAALQQHRTAIPDPVQADGRFTTSLRSALVEWRDHEDAEGLRALGLSSGLFPHHMFDSESAGLAGGAGQHSPITTASTSAPATERTRVRPLYLQFSADETERWTAVDAPPYLFGMSWREWLDLPLFERANEDFHVRTDELSQSHLEDLAIILSKADAPDLAQKVRNYSEGLDSAARDAREPDSALVRWTGDEVYAMGRRLNEDYTRIVEDFGSVTDVNATASSLRYSADRVAGSLNGFILDAAHLGGIDRLRRDFVPVVAAARNLANFMEHWAEHGHDAQEFKAPVSAAELAQLTPLIRAFRREAAYERLTQGRYWHLSDPLLAGQDRAGKVGYIKGRSQQNIANLREETRVLLQDPRNADVHRRLSDLPLVLQHATGALNSIRRDGRISSLADLRRRKKDHLIGGTDENDIVEMGNDDWVYTRVTGVLPPDTKPTSRFGSATVEATFENIIRLDGWISLFDGLEPLHKEAMQELVWNGKTVRTSHYISGDHNRWTASYPESGTPTHTNDLIDVVFTGADAREGLILHVIAESHRIGGDFLRDIQNEEDPHRLWHMVSRLVRPEAKFLSSPFGPLASQSDEGVRQIHVYDEDKGDYRADGLYEIPRTGTNEYYAGAFSEQLSGSAWPSRLLNLLTRHAATAGPDGFEKFEDAFLKDSGTSVDDAIENAARTGTISQAVRDDLRRELAYARADKPVVDFHTGVNSVADLVAHPAVQYISAQIHDEIAAHQQGQQGAFDRISEHLEMMQRSMPVIRAVMSASDQAFGGNLWEQLTTIFPQHIDRINSLFGESSTAPIPVQQMRALYDRLHDLEFRSSSGEYFKVNGYPEGYDDVRLHLWHAELNRVGITTETISVARGDNPLEFSSVDAHEATNESPGMVQVNERVAPLVTVLLLDGESKKYVLDPTLGRGPLTVNKWLENLGVLEKNPRRFVGTAPDVQALIQQDQQYRPQQWASTELPHRAAVAIVRAPGHNDPMMHRFPVPGRHLYSSGQFHDLFLQNQGQFAADQLAVELHGAAKKLYSLAAQWNASGITDEVSMMEQIANVLAGERGWTHLLHDYEDLRTYLQGLFSPANYEHIETVVAGASPDVL